jgi:hypothetical protein
LNTYRAVGGIQALESLMGLIRPWGIYEALKGLIAFENPKGFVRSFEDL